MLNGIVSRLRKQEVRLWHSSVEKPAGNSTSPMLLANDFIQGRHLDEPSVLPSFPPPLQSVSVPVALSSDGKKDGGKKPAIRGHNEFKSAALREGKPAIV